MNHSQITKYKKNQEHKIVSGNLRDSELATERKKEKRQPQRFGARHQKERNEATSEIRSSPPKERRKEKRQPPRFGAHHRKKERKK